MTDSANLRSLIANSRSFIEIKNNMIKTDNLIFQSQSNETMNNSKTLRDRWNSKILSIDQNLEMLSTNKHTIQKIVLEGEVNGLSIPHNKQKEVLDLMTSITSSMQKIQETNKVANPGIANDLIEQTKTLTEQTKDRLKSTKSTINQLEIFNHNVTTIQKHKDFEDETDDDSESFVIREI